MVAKVRSKETAILLTTRQDQKITYNINRKGRLDGGNDENEAIAVYLMALRLQI
jgi:hypothetical protein